MIFRFPWGMFGVLFAKLGIATVSVLERPNDYQNEVVALSNKGTNIFEEIRIPLLRVAIVATSEPEC